MGLWQGLRAMPHHDGDVDDGDSDDDHNALDHEHADHYNGDHGDDDNQKRSALQGLLRGEQDCEWQSVDMLGAACSYALLGDTVSFALVMTYRRAPDSSLRAHSTMPQF